MNRFTFNHVLLLINEHISSDIMDRGRHTISAKAQLLIALWHFGTPDSYRYELTFIKICYIIYVLNISDFPF